MQVIDINPNKMNTWILILLKNDLYQKDLDEQFQLCEEKYSLPKTQAKWKSSMSALKSA